MNRRVHKVATGALLVAAITVIPGAYAFAQEAPTQAPAPKLERGHRGGLLRAAQKLDTLTAEQRSAIEQLVQQRRAANVPVRQADAQVLTVLAQQVEQAQVDPQGLAASLGAEQSAATSAGAIDRDTLNQLHALLTTAQRQQVVDAVRAQRSETRHRHHERGAKLAKLGLSPQQKAQVEANLRAERDGNRGAQHPGAGMLDAFRGDSFDAGAWVHTRVRGERAERFAQAVVPVLNPAQRAKLASELRARAEHESKGRS